MKVLFLDFDGVLNSFPYLKENGHAAWQCIGEAGAIDPAAVERLNRIVERTGAKVVVSSSWRHGRDEMHLWQLLRKRGFRGVVIGKTPDFVPNKQPLSKRACGGRGDEIRHWLDNTPAGVTRFVVLDDDNDMDAVRDFFVRTSMDTGLTDEHVEMAVGMLGEATVPKKPKRKGARARGRT